MCGGIKYSPTVKNKRGDMLPIEFGDRTINARWNDHARSESLYKFTDKGWVIAWLPAKTYTEGHNPEVEFQVPEGKRIKVVVK
jgi:hypothetical protein